MQDAGSRAHPWGTVRAAVRTAWDTLGFTCAISLTLFVACSPLAIAAPAGIGLGLPMAIAAYALVTGPIVAGACCLAWRIAARDEPSYLDLWRGALALYGPAAALAGVQGVVASALSADVVLFLRLGPPVGIILSAIAGYALAFWCLASVYHWPLLIAGDEGVLQGPNGGRPSLAALLRNASVITLSAPGFTLAVAAAIIAGTTVMVLSGIGAALVAGGLAVHLMVQSVRDQLVRFGALPPPPDVDSPVEDTRWRVE